jgi:hypothetical protein
MFHMEGFSVSDTTSGANTYVQALYITTNIVLPSQNNGVQVSPQLANLHSVFGLGASMTHVRVQTPAFLPQPYPNLDPVNRGTALESPPRIKDFSSRPLPLGPTDEFDVYVAQNSGGTETERVFVNFTDGVLMPVPAGKVFTVHATSAITVTANKFTPCIPVLDYPLPGGQYALVGARAFGATAIAFRILPSMGPIWRPGGVAVQTYDQLDPPGQRIFGWDGNPGATWGVWMTFYQNVLFQVEMFCSSADTAQEFDFDLVQISTATI